MPLLFLSPFLDASTHLYKRLCPSVRPLVRPLVRGSVRNPLTKNVITARKLKENSGKHHQVTHRIAFLFEIQEDSRKFKKIQYFIGRIVVRIELVSFL